MVVQQLWHNSNPCIIMPLIWLVLNEVLPIVLGVLRWEKAPFVNLCKEHIEISKHCHLDCWCIIFLWSAFQKVWLKSVLPPILSSYGNIFTMRSSTPELIWRKIFERTNESAFMYFKQLFNILHSFIIFFGLSVLTIEPIASTPRRMCFLVLGRLEWRLGSLLGDSRKIAQERLVYAR